TRATVFQTFYNMEGQPAVTEAASFADVAGTWYADSAAWAEDAGLTTGDGTGAYAGDRAVTRAELATIVVRYAQYKDMALTAGDLSAYADSADVAEWASEGMSLAVGSGVLSGKDGNRLDPNGTAVRVELATILMNYANNMAPAEETDASLTLSEYLDTTDYTWFLTGKTSYAIQGKMVSASTDVYNELEDVSYTAEPNGQDVVLKGTAGEEWVTSLEKVLETYTKPDGSALTAEDFVADTYIDLQTKAEPDTNYACFIPAGTVVVVETAWGDVLTANRAEVPHGDGDYLVCTVDDAGQPNLSDVWVVNGEIFPDTYDMTNAQSSQADAA
uniref:S-layer homology domain-containing protein n=1 Tax=uncultured Intestinimonas sp. TaxID=1689265 RepID=UPI0025DC3EB5